MTATYRERRISVWVEGCDTAEIEAIRESLSEVFRGAGGRAAIQIRSSRKPTRRHSRRRMLFEEDESEDNAFEKALHIADAFDKRF